MESLPRHRCLIYDGPPSKQLPALVAVTREKLQQNIRCLYLNSPAMVAGMRSCLAAAGVDVAREIERGSLILSSEQNLVYGYLFEVKHMIDGLRAALGSALHDGFSGLWATGDMAWEFGPQKDFSKLLEYEWRLEEFLALNPQMSGVCQYRADILPRAAMRQGLLSHSGIFVNETLSLINPQFHTEISPDAADNFELDSYVNSLIAQGAVN
jgi:hypothetical protein